MPKKNLNRAQEFAVYAWIDANWERVKKLSLREMCKEVQKTLDIELSEYIMRSLILATGRKIENRGGSNSAVDRPKNLAVFNYKLALTVQRLCDRLGVVSAFSPDEVEQINRMAKGETFEQFSLAHLSGE